MATGRDFRRTLTSKAGRSTLPGFRMSLRKCPYCEHPNSTDAKFCVACGAIMHLAPCPHCGAVNDISSPKCYRCHGDLPGEQALVIEGEAAVAAATPATGATPAGGAAEAPSGRPSLMVVSVIALTFASAAYFAYRQRSAIAPPVATPAPAAEVRESPAAKGAITKAAPAPASPPTASPAPAAVAPAPATVAAEPAPARERASRARRQSTEAATTAVTAAPPVAAPAPTPPASAPAANRGPCTEAVAALGLCKPETK